MQCIQKRNVFRECVRVEYEIKKQIFFIHHVVFVHNCWCCYVVSSWMLFYIFFCVFDYFARGFCFNVKNWTYIYITQHRTQTHTQKNGKSVLKMLHEMASKGIWKKNHCVNCKELLFFPLFFLLCVSLLLLFKRACEWQQKHKCNSSGVRWVKKNLVI